MAPIKRFCLLFFVASLAAASFTMDAVAKTDEGIRNLGPDEKAGRQGMGFKALQKVLLPLGKTEVKDCYGGQLVEGSTDEAGRLDIYSPVNNMCTILFSKKYSREPFCVVSATHESLVVSITEESLSIFKPDNSGLSIQGVNYICRLPHE